MIYKVRKIILYDKLKNGEIIKNSYEPIISNIRILSCS
jgi:hypothetical protein